MHKMLFLDRDGIINVDHGYVFKIENFQFNEGIFDLLHLFKRYGYSFFIVTNQSGIGRGLYTADDFQLLTTWMLQQFKLHHLTIEDVFYCPHSPEENCFCRKPSLGMIQNILNQNNIDLKHSWMIGDKQSDIDFAKQAHIGSSVAIKNKTITNSTYFFDTILTCKEYLEENQGKILS